MPKQTFFNLPEEKRDRILDVALSEFSERGYKEASISRMVAGSGIAKGSFYQYFEDKDDLFVHLIYKSIGERKLRVFAEEQGRLADLTLTEFLREVFQRLMREFQANPRVLKVGMDLLTLTRDPIYGKVMDHYHGDLDSFFSPFIQYEMNQGDLDSKVNIQLLNFMLMSLGQYLTALLAGGASISPALIDRMVDDLEYIFTYGIYGKGGR